MEKNFMSTIITFCGHKDIGDRQIILNKLLEVLEPYFKGQAPLTFYCGGYGGFDSVASQAIDILKLKYPHVKAEKILVTPYITPDYQERINDMKKLYDDVVYPPLENVPFKFAISRRNEWMVENSDIVIAYVKYSWGGAAKTLAYANRKHKQICNLCDQS
jgi:uncharacterized phage-like protein YoqJ